MDYSDVNKKHFMEISQIYVDPNGKCLISLENGETLSADSPKDADDILSRLERKDNNE